MYVHEVYLRGEQVADGLVVKLAVRAPHENLSVSTHVAVGARIRARTCCRPTVTAGRNLPYVIEYLLERRRDDTGLVGGALHGVGLACTRGPVAEDRAVVSAGEVGGFGVRQRLDWR